MYHVSASFILGLLATSICWASASADPQPQQTAQSTSTVIVELPTSTILIIATATTIPASSTVTISTTTPSSPQYTSPLDLKTSILNSTNFFRYEHSAPFLDWNASLASYASKYAAQCIWAHSHGAPGENLARGYPDITSAVDAWGNERSLYSFSGSQTGFTEATGHFTQLVWQATQTVGCAAYDCNGTNGLDGWFTVCEYWPAGNIVAAGSDPNQFFVQNVAAQANNGSGFDVASATAGASGVGTSLATGSIVPVATGTTTTSSSGAASYRVTSRLALSLGLATTILFHLC